VNHTPKKAIAERLYSLPVGFFFRRKELRFSALHTFQAFGNSEKPPRNNGLRGALAVE
jgi:hypothetical protein